MKMDVGCCVEPNIVEYKDITGGVKGSKIREVNRIEENYPTDLKAKIASRNTDPTVGKKIYNCSSNNAAISFAQRFLYR